jgi:putative spermidine/putrescine transport system ATP-binding protein
MSFLVLRGLTKRYDSVVAVQDFDLTVERGEYVSLLGPSGCGKTTMLQMVAGFVTPTAGSIRLDGQDITEQKPSRRGLGIVFQSYALFPHMTVTENVGFGLEMRKVERSERKARIDEALALVHLEALAERYPRELSGGQRQRVALARALVIKPPVLLLDEPLGALDAKLRHEMQIELRALQHHIGVTTIMVTHDQEEAMTLSDRVVLMNLGRIEQVGKPYEMYEQPNGRFASTFLGKANVLVGRRESGQAPVQVGAHRLPAGDGSDVGAVDYVVRPEKVSFVTADRALLGGTVEARAFLGNYWLFQVATDVGLVQVTLPNTGLPEVNEGDRVSLAWSPQHARVLRHEPGAAA